MTATDIRVVFNRMLTPDTDLASMTQQIASLTTALSHKEQIFHMLHNDTSLNSVVVDTGNPMTLSLGENPADSVYHNGYQVPCPLIISRLVYLRLSSVGNLILLVKIFLPVVVEHHHQHHKLVVFIYM